MMPTFLSLYDKLEKLVQRLPEGLRQPIMREITPIKSVFLLQRPPRLVLLGERSVSRTALVNALFAESIARDTEDSLQQPVWQNFVREGRGTVRILDARLPAQLATLKRALGAEVPDLFLFLRESAPEGGNLEADLDHAHAIIAYAESCHDSRAKLLAVPAREEAADTLELLWQREALAERTSGGCALSESAQLTELIAIELPPESQLEMARVSRNRVLQTQISQVVIKSVTAICGAIGAQPIPLADFPILTSLQAMMVASIMHVRGREMSIKLGAKFLGALGANIGAGLALREGARAAAKLLPVWGSAISGAVAAAGTYAIGRAAVAYFIEGVSLSDARQIFRRKRGPTPLLKE
ncbi:MAG: hypothetical protein M3463_22450 [Verrucomicrobiota bacterium]|nr:hypothetical protein [Verrucomicrobiota bacterium]